MPLIDFDYAFQSHVDLSRSSKMDCVYQITTGRSGLEEKVAVLSVGMAFEYVLPFFDVLAVELRQVQIERQLNDATERFDAFIRNDNDIDLMYPSSLLVTDAFFIEACNNFD